jgi:hypothetical protein
MKLGSLLFRFLDSNSHEGRPFAVTPTFQINDRVLMVTLPYGEDSADFSVVLNDYRSLLADRSMPHSIYPGRFGAGCFEIDPTPLRMQYALEPTREEQAGDARTQTE